jgi:hypothetical protein
MREPNQKRGIRRPEHRDRGWQLSTETNRSVVRGAEVTNHPAPGETRPISGNRSWQNSHGAVE